MNLSYINWYLVELRRRLHDAMPLDQENSFVMETKNHLESLTEEFQTHGMDQRGAEIAAIERFGTPDSIASNCLVALRGVRDKRLVRIAGIALAIALVLFGLLETTSAPRSVGLPIYYSVAALAIFAFVVGKFRTTNGSWLLLLR